MKNTPPPLDMLTITVAEAQTRLPLYGVWIPGKAGNGPKQRFYCINHLHAEYSGYLAYLDFETYGPGGVFRTPVASSPRELIERMTIRGQAAPGYIFRMSGFPAHDCCLCPTMRTRHEGHRTHSEPWQRKPIHKR